jgi:nucleotide-binding universal stress UspA family protein
MTMSGSEAPETTRRTVVVGYDGSFSARQAVAHGVALAGGGGRVVIVHAREAEPRQMTSRWRELLEADHEEHGRAILDSILLEGNDKLANADWETRLVAARPAEAILAVADELDADAIVVGSHGYSSVSALVGSVSHELLRVADRPVTVIPPQCIERRETSNGFPESTARSQH